MDDPVRRLWAQAVAAKTDAEVRVILPQLHAAIRNRIRRLALMAAKESHARGTDRRAA